MKIKMIYIILLITISLSGCGTMFLGTHDLVNFNTKPSGAAVFIDGIEQGKTPMELELSTNKTYVVVFKKDGYEDAIYSITSHTSAMVVVLDICFWPFLIVDAVNGTWYYLEETEIDATLEIKKLN